MPRDTDRPDPYIAAPLGPPIRQAAPAPAPAPSKQPQPGAMDVSDIGMIMRDCHPRPVKPTKLNEQQRADWLRMSAEPEQTTKARPRRHGETIGDLFRLEGHTGELFAVVGFLKENGKPIIRPMGYRDDSLPLLDPCDFSVIQAPERPKIDVDKAVQWVDERLPKLHPRRHLDWPVIDPDMIEQAPRRRAAWLPEVE
jgi:hypothetical protein